MLGLTFKENVPDLRNSRSFDLVRRLQWLGHEVDGRRPAAPTRRRSSASTALTVADARRAQYDLVVGAVAHRDYRELPDARIEALVAPGGTLADFKGMWRDRTLDPAIDRWTL